jgi:hypothetical protein
VPWLIEKPARIRAAGTVEKQIEEFVGRLNTGHQQVSVARMVSPAGWSEPAQCADFMEISVVLRGELHAHHDGCKVGSTRTGDAKPNPIIVAAGQALIVQAGETVRYETPGEGGAEYVAICLPAFSADTVNRVA